MIHDNTIYRARTPDWIEKVDNDPALLNWIWFWCTLVISAASLLIWTCTYFMYDHNLDKTVKDPTGAVMPLKYIVLCFMLAPSYVYAGYLALRRPFVIAWVRNYDTRKQLERYYDLNEYHQEKLNPLARQIIRDEHSAVFNEPRVEAFEKAIDAAEKYELAHPVADPHVDAARQFIDVLAEMERQEKELAGG